MIRKFMGKNNASEEIFSLNRVRIINYSTQPTVSTVGSWIHRLV